MWATERAHRLSRQPLRWAGDTDPGTCERCGAEGAAKVCLFDTGAWAYDLCDRCEDRLARRRLVAMNKLAGWGAQIAVWDWYSRE
jgi:hypothetical protein